MLSSSSELFLTKFNICIGRYIYYIDEMNAELLVHLEPSSDLLDKIVHLLNSESENIIILKFVIDKLNKFSKTYDVDIENIDDFKIVYFISLYFIESEICSTGDSKKIILMILHRIMSSSLLAYEPKIILDKLKKFIRKNTYAKFYEEYGDIGYYHTIKSIYLMQEISAKILVNEHKLDEESSIVTSYFKRLDKYE